MEETWIRKFGFQGALNPGTDLSEIAQCIYADLAAYLQKI